MQTLTNLTNENRIFYRRALLSRLLPNLFFYNYGVKAHIDPNKGNKINFRRFNSIDLSQTNNAITEGTVPSESTMTVSKIEVALSQYGAYLAISDQLDLMGIDPVITETAINLGETAALNIDTVVRDIVSAGTNVVFPRAAITDIDEILSTDIITSTVVKKAVLTLKKNNVKPCDDGYYHCIIHPAVANDLMSDTLWQDVSKYNGGEAIMKGEIGRMYGVKFFESTNAKARENGAQTPVMCYATMIFGKEAFGVVDLNGLALPEFFIEGPGGNNDPLHQKSTVGYKMLFACTRLNEKCLCRIDSAASA